MKHWLECVNPEDCLYGLQDPELHETCVILASEDVNQPLLLIYKIVFSVK